VQALDLSLLRWRDHRTFCFSVQGLSPWWTELVGKGALCRHSDHENYAYSGGRDPTLGLKGLESGT
jgi:hypothetical protein